MVTALPASQQGVWRTGLRQIFVGYAAGHEECFDVYNPKPRRVTQRYYKDCQPFPPRFPLREASCPALFFELGAADAMFFQSPAATTTSSTAAATVSTTSPTSSTATTDVHDEVKVPLEEECLVGNRRSGCVRHPVNRFDPAAVKAQMDHDKLQAERAAMFTDNVYLACRDPDYDNYTLPQHVLHVRVATPEKYKAASNEDFCWKRWRFRAST